MGEWTLSKKNGQWAFKTEQSVTTSDGAEPSIRTVQDRSQLIVQPQAASGVPPGKQANVLPEGQPRFIEAMEADKGELSVTIIESPNTYSVSIKDNGKGIPPEHLSKLFEPFFTMKKNGMGLGLSAAYGIFKSHKATMHVESLVDNGTTFIMDFEKHFN